MGDWQHFGVHICCSEILDIFKENYSNLNQTKAKKNKIAFLKNKDHHGKCLQKKGSLPIQSQGVFLL